MNRRETLIARNTKHGLSHLPEYRRWKDMRARCRNPNNTEFKNYGGRGITVCDRWNNFEVFLSDMGRKPEGTTIDRIDVNGNYEPSNCRWATAQQQANNTRQNVWLEMDGERHTIAQWSVITGLSESRINHRLRVGKCAKDALIQKDLRLARPNAPN